MDRREDLILLTPGPVHIDPARLAALPPMHHRTGLFREMVLETGRMLGDLCGTERSAFLMAASGTGAMEAVVAGLAGPGAKVLVVEGGKFGRRWAEIAGALGCSVDVVSFGMGERIDCLRVAERVAAVSPDIVAVTQVESSTGLFLDIEELVSELPDRRALLAVDAIASVGSERILMDEWGIDILAGAGQKALAAPPGLSFVIAGPRAMEAAAVNPRKQYYFSLERYEKGMKTGDTPFTPAIHSVQLLHSSLTAVTSAGARGIGDVLARHRLASAALLGAAGALGMHSLPDVESRSVQALLPPEGVSCDMLITGLGERHGVVVAGGQDEMAGRIIRTGFPGIYGHAELARLIEGLAEILTDYGVAVDSQAALRSLEPMSGLQPLYDSLLT